MVKKKDTQGCLSYIMPYHHIRTYLRLHRRLAQAQLALGRGQPLCRPLEHAALLVVAAVPG